MATKVLKLDSDTDYWNVIREAATCLVDGGLVVFPTETVYGVGTHAARSDAVRRLREVKQRSDEKPFTVHIGSRSQVDRFVPNLDGLGRRLTEKAWPGPLTLVFEIGAGEQAQVLKETPPDAASAMYHNGTIGIRCPSDRAAADLLTEAKVPIVAASANPAGAGAPIDADEALAALDGKVDLVLDGGTARYARPSTIVRVTRNGCEVLREGVIERRTVERLMATNFLVVCSGNTCRSPMAAGLLRRLLAEKLDCPPEDLPGRGCHVESAGVSAMSGSLPSPSAVRAMKSKGIDIADHRARPLTVEQIMQADYIFAMTRSHVAQIASMSPPAGDRTMRLADEDIEDPIGGSDDQYVRCAEQIEQALKQRLNEVKL